MTTSPLPPADPDEAAAADDARRFRRTMVGAAAIVVAMAAGGAGVGLLLGGPLSEVLRLAGSGALVAVSLLLLAHTFVVDARPKLAARLALSGNINGDERERRIAGDTTVRVFAVTLIVVMLYATVIAKSAVPVFLCCAGMAADIVIRQIRTRRP